MGLLQTLCICSSWAVIYQYEKSFITRFASEDSDQPVCMGFHEINPYSMFILNKIGFLRFCSKYMNKHIHLVWWKTFYCCFALVNSENISFTHLFNSEMISMNSHLTVSFWFSVFILLNPASFIFIKWFWYFHLVCWKYIKR